MKFIDLLGMFFILIFWSLYCCCQCSMKKKYNIDNDQLEIKNMDSKIFCCGTPQNSPRARSSSRFFNGLDDFNDDLV